MKPMDIPQLKQIMADELEQRRSSTEVFSYSENRGDEEELYGLTGAVNLMAALGLPIGDRALRRQCAERILSYRDDKGMFMGSSGPGHALHMVVGTLNLLGEPMPEVLAPLAPTDPAALDDWLDRHDWESTHKELCGQTIPLLAGGLVSHEWLQVFSHSVAARLNPDHPLETWCAADAPPWRVISCVFHVLSAFDAGRLPYPQPELLMQRLLNLQWDKVPDTEQRTFCTDGDWALVLLQLCNVLPAYFEQVMAAIRRVSARRVREWEMNRADILEASTHHLYCYLWVTAVFQSYVRDHYIGGFLRDTLNDPALFRL